MWPLFLIGGVVIVGGWLWGASKVASNAPPINPGIPPQVFRNPIPGTSGQLGGSILVGDRVVIAAGQFFNPQFLPPGVDINTPIRCVVLEPVGNMTPLGVPSILVRPLDSRAQDGLDHLVPLSSVLLVERA